MTPETGLDLTDERSRVLKLLEDGKITAPEAADLLGALTASHAGAGVATAPRGPLSLDRRLGWAGAAIVLIAFFLPWFSYDMGAELAAVVQSMPGVPGNPLPTPAPGSFTMGRTLNGGDVGKGFGWMVLGLSIVAAMIPGFHRHFSAQMRWNLRVAAVAIGGIILTYLLTSDFRFADVGIFLALLGYGLHVIAVILEARPLLSGGGGASSLAAAA